MKRRLQNSLATWMAVLPALLAGCSSTSPSDYVLPPNDDGDAKESFESHRCQLPINAEDLFEDLFDRVQVERDKQGLPPLVLDETLCTVADDHACAMIEGGFFAHIDPKTESSPGSRLTVSGYIFHTVGENLAAGQRTVAEVVEQWMESPGHRANILCETWRETGIAVRSGGDYGVYWVQIFADPADFGEPSPADAASFSP